MIRINIDKILEEQNKTCFWLAKNSKLGYNNLKKLTNNNTDSIKFENLEAIARTLGVGVADIIEIVED
ncbi:helix-turn-helix transcriptional regulator [Clostridium estertheticum]|uniref:helix-turn-helix domain-containing protein n=1 Tax=Clostridium estertheticum TaxID=238834 RepID=UPI001C0AB706|nr:helix-turn-helix domain-containing protein [Clostridium estertheticum]MBU3215843.1 helix-turn-helix transcriptional regulator [Clostridium estertheticum]WAG57798.1 helix-turn-helix transcriptional regulator [Clostridium estertheticum]